MEHVPRPPPRMVRLSDLQSAWECSRSAGLEMRNPKVTLKSQIGHLEPVLGPVEKSKEFEDLGLLAGRVQMETCPGHKVNHPRANQTSKWTNTYPTNGNQSHPGAFRHIFSIFSVSSSASFQNHQNVICGQTEENEYSSTGAKVA